MHPIMSMVFIRSNRDFVGYYFKMLMSQRTASGHRLSLIYARIKQKQVKKKLVLWSNKQKQHILPGVVMFDGMDDGGVKNATTRSSVHKEGRKEDLKASRSHRGSRVACMWTCVKA